MYSNIEETFLKIFEIIFLKGLEELFTGTGSGSGSGSGSG